MTRVLVTPRSLTRAPGPEVARLEAAGLEVVDEQLAVLAAGTSG